MAEQIEKKKSGLATAGMVLGIIGVCTSFIPIVNNLSFVMGILAIIFGIIEIIKKAGRGKAIAGLILGILAIIITLSSQKAISDALDTLSNDLNSITGSTVEITEYNKGEIAVLGDSAITVTKVEKSQGNSWDKPASGKEFVIVTVAIENKGQKNLSYNPYDFKMQNSQGQQESMTFTTIDQDTQLNSGELIPGGKVTGTITFEQPKGDTNLALIYNNNVWSSKDIKIKL